MGKYFRVEIHTMKESNGRITHYVVGHRPDFVGDIFESKGKITHCITSNIEEAWYEAYCFEQFLNVPIENHRDKAEFFDLEWVNPRD